MAASSTSAQTNSKTSDRVTVLPYATIQPSSMQVEADVASSGAPEEYWVSVYKAGHSSVHGRVHCRLAEGQGLVKEPKGVKLQPAAGSAAGSSSTPDWIVNVPELDVNQVRLRRPVAPPATWHPQGVEAFDFVQTSSDSAAVVSGSINGSLRITHISLSTGESSSSTSDHSAPLEPRGHVSDITSAQFFPSGNKVVLTTSLDATARLWNAETGTNPRTLKGHTRAVTSAALIPPQGQQVLTTSLDSTLRQWDLRTGEEVFKIDLGMEAPASQVVLHPSDPNIAFVALRTSSGTVAQVDLAKQQVVQRLEDSAAPINALAVARDGSRLLAGDQAGLCTLWDLTTPSNIALCQWRRNDAAVLTVSASATANDWLVGGADGLPYRVRVNSPKESGTDTTAANVELVEEFGCATEEEAENVIKMVEKDGVVGVAGGKSVVFYPA